MKKDSVFSTVQAVFFMALCSCILWGSSFALVKISYREFQIDASDLPTLIHYAGFRYLIAGLITFLAGSILAKKLFVPRKESFGKIVRISLLQTVGQYVFLYIGMANTSGVNSSILNSCSVFVAIVLAAFVFHQEKLGRGKIIGCLVGFAGVLLINLSGSSLGTVSFLGEGCVILGSCSHAIAQCLMKKYAVDENPFIISGWQFAIGGAIMVLLGFLAGGRMETATTTGIVIVLYLALSSAVAFGLWSTLLKYNPVSRVAIFAFMTPVFGVLLSAMILRETSALHAGTWIALLLVCAGIVLVNRAQETKA